MTPEPVQIDFILGRMATNGLFQPDMHKLFSEAEREAVGKEFEGWLLENFTPEGAGVRTITGRMAHWHTPFQVFGSFGV